MGFLVEEISGEFHNATSTYNSPVSVNFNYTLIRLPQFLFSIVASESGGTFSSIRINPSWTTERSER
jgi:hypothetical protein